MPSNMRTASRRSDAVGLVLAAAFYVLCQRCARYGFPTKFFGKNNELQRVQRGPPRTSTRPRTETPPDGDDPARGRQIPADVPAARSHLERSRFRFPKTKRALCSRETARGRGGAEPSPAPNKLSRDLRLVSSSQENPRSGREVRSPSRPSRAAVGSATARMPAGRAHGPPGPAGEPPHSAALRRGVRRGRGSIHQKYSSRFRGKVSATIVTYTYIFRLDR